MVVFLILHWFVTPPPHTLRPPEKTISTGLFQNYNMQDFKLKTSNFTSG